MIRKRRNPLVLFVAGCPVTKKIHALVTKELQRISENIDCKMLYSYKFHRAFTYSLIDKSVFAVKEMLEKERPDVVVVGDDGSVNATFIKIAKDMGIPSLAIQVGMLSEKEFEGSIDILRTKNYFLWRFISLISNNTIVRKLTLSIGWRTRVLDWGLSGTDKIAVFGDFYKKLLISRGVPSDKISVTGYVLLDELFHYVSNHSEQLIKSKIYNKIGIDKEKHLITLITQPLVEDEVWTKKQYEIFLNIIRNAIRKNNSLHLVIKPHPREELQKYRSIINNLPFRNRVKILDKNFDLTELLIASDVVIMSQSTVAYWALVTRKPMISVRPFFLHYRFTLGDFVLTINNCQELSYALQKLIKTKSRYSKRFSGENRLISEHLYKIDGKASERVAKLIKNMLRD